MRNDKVVIIRSFEYDPLDVAVAFNKVAERIFGNDPFIGTKIGTIIRDRRPVTFTSVKIGLNQEVRVAIRDMEIKGVQGQFMVDGSTIEAEVAKKEAERVERFFTEIKNHLETSSIYKGKAITSGREFLDLDKINLDRLAYNQRVLNDLRDHLWVLIERTAECEQLGVRPQRKILFEGRFGSGKTMAILVTAQKALRNGFTFFYLEPTAKSASGMIEFMLELAKKYQPAILAIEDFNREQREGDIFALGRLMAAIDGMLSKNNDIIVILTTNFKDKIAGGLKRPGRIDKSINFDIFTPEDVEKLLRILIPSAHLSADINWSRISSAASHLTPAFINEVGTGTKLVAVSRSREKTPIVTEAMFMDVIEGLQDQHKACEAAEQQMGFAPDRQ